MNSVQQKTSDTQAAYERYADMLYRVAYLELQSKEDAEDTIAEVFYKFMKKNPNFKDAEHEKAWFLRVTLNQCRDLARKRVVRRYTPLDEVMELPSTEQLCHDVLEDVLSLPEKYKVVMILFYYEELKIEEIATVLKVTEGTVKMRLKRGRECLRKRMEDVVADDN